MCPSRALVSSETPGLHACPGRCLLVNPKGRPSTAGIKAELSDMAASLAVKEEV